MKLSRSRPRWTVIACVAVVIALVLPAAAFGSLSDPWLGTSKTNPNLPPEPWPGGSAAPPNEWRQGWGNSLYPEITINLDSVPRAESGTPTLGFLYTLTRPQFQSMPDTSAFDISWDPQGSMIEHVLDFQGIFNGLSLPERSYITTSAQIQHDPREGRWYYNMRFFNESDIATGYSYYDFGLDLTPPRPVLGFTSGVAIPTETSRRKFTWVNTEYDDMSRGAWYELYVNDMKKPVKHIQIVPWLPGAATIEDLPPGVNTIGIRVMDRATNEGPMVTHTDIVDPDYPTLSVTPDEGSWLRGTATFSATAADEAGISKVNFWLDGSLRQSSATARTYSVNTKDLRAGAHTLVVSAYDLFGHVRSLTRTFYVDNTPPVISSVSHSPDPWYPCIQDGYKDVATFKAYVNERVSDVFAQLYSEDGTKLIAEGHVQNVGPGWVTASFDGKDSDGNPLNIGPIGSYAFLKWRFTARDRAGNWTNMPFQTIEVRNFEIVSNPSGGVKVVPR